MIDIFNSEKYRFFYELLCDAAFLMSDSREEDVAVRKRFHT